MGRGVSFCRTFYERLQGVLNGLARARHGVTARTWAARRNARADGCGAFPAMVATGARSPDRLADGCHVEPLTFAGTVAGRGAVAAFDGGGRIDWRRIRRHGRTADRRRTVAATGAGAATVEPPRRARFRRVVFGGIFGTHSTGKHGITRARRKGTRRRRFRRLKMGIARNYWAMRAKRP